MDDENSECDDPGYVDELLSKELLELSVNDRNGIQEEIHGVGCLAPEETPELVNRSMEKLSLELCEVSLSLPQTQTRAYRKSQTFANTYVNEREFRLRFLRCELFDIPKTARRVCSFLEWVLVLFGEYGLQRPVTLHDFTKEEMKYFRKGYYQCLPYRDRSGRRIICIIPGGQVPMDTRSKIALYTSWAAGCNDVDTQRKGIVYLAWFDKTIKTSHLTPKVRAKDHEVSSIRASAIHCCTPDTPLFRFRRSIMTMRIASHNRYKLKVHMGDSMENRYTLQTYGIPSDQIPLTWSGTIKLTYHRQWIRLRQSIEQRELGQRLSGMSPSAFYHVNCNTMIDCPCLNDVLFRQGTSTTSHPGNVAFRALIEARLRELETLQQLEATTKENKKCGTRKKKGSSKQTKTTNVKTRKLVMDVIEEIQRRQNGRILFWNEMGWWDEATDQDQIYLKVEYIVREYRLGLKRKKRSDEDVEQERSRVRAMARAKPEPTVSMSLPDQQPSSSALSSHQGESRAATPEHPSDDDSTIIPIRMVAVDIAPPTIVDLKGGTSIFLDTQDVGLMSRISTKKRPRLNNPFANEDDENNQIMGECFGMKFLQC